MFDVWSVICGTSARLLAMATFGVGGSDHGMNYPNAVAYIYLSHSVTESAAAKREIQYFSGIFTIFSLRE